jgi:D-serine deaminase-like pyridoxal phosphate-dependent protein
MFQAADMPLTILTEVVSMYPGRGTNETTEALIAAGRSAFGIESHPTLGYGTVDSAIVAFHPNNRWYVKEAGKESAVLASMGNEEVNAFQCGQRVKINPYNAANATERFGWYLVVDSGRIDHGDEIVDVFVRWRD